LLPSRCESMTFPLTFLCFQFPPLPRTERAIRKEVFPPPPQTSSHLSYYVTTFCGRNPSFSSPSKGLGDISPLFLPVQNASRGRLLVPFTLSFRSTKFSKRPPLLSSCFDDLSKCLPCLKSIPPSAGIGYPLWLRAKIQIGSLSRRSLTSNVFAILHTTIDFDPIVSNTPSFFL